MLVQHARGPEQAQCASSPVKNHVASKSPVGDISVVTLIRTDTTLDHSQKAEKVWSTRREDKGQQGKLTICWSCLVRECGGCGLGADGKWAFGMQTPPLSETLVVGRFPGGDHALHVIGRKQC